MKNEILTHLHDIAQAGRVAKEFLSKRTCFASEAPSLTIQKWIPSAKATAVPHKAPDMAAMARWALRYLKISNMFGYLFHPQLNVAN